MTTIYQPTTQDHIRDIAQWVTTRIKDCGCVDNPIAGIAVLNGANQVIAAATYHSYRQTDIEILFAADTPRWATRANIKAFIDYPFTLGCRRITAIVHPKNRRIRRFMEGIGFVHEGTARDGFPSANALIYGLTSRDWNKSKVACHVKHRSPNGKEEPERARSA